MVCTAGQQGPRAIKATVFGYLALHEAQMPFAGNEGMVASILQYFWQCCDITVCCRNQA